MEVFEKSEMGVGMRERLLDEVEFFSQWAKETHPECDEEHDNGEWESGVDNHFDEMIDAARKVFENTNSREADEEIVDALLYAIARDNECEMLAEELLQYEDWFELLARRSINSVYVNAAWQFAKRVGHFESCHDMLYDFIESKHEYTSRMALQSLADISPEKAESYAVSFWERGEYPEGSYEDEYQKIMALHVLHKISSPKLEEYVRKALELPYKYLKENAEGIWFVGKEDEEKQT